MKFSLLSRLKQSNRKVRKGTQSAQSKTKPNFCFAHFAKLCVLCGAFLSLGAVEARGEARGDCLMFAARNIAKGNGNFYIYCNVSNEKLKIEKGDALEYDIY